MNSVCEKYLRKNFRGSELVYTVIRNKASALFLLLTTIFGISFPAFAETNSGEILYNNTCVFCHAKTGTGTATGLMIGNPNLTKKDGPLCTKDYDTLKDEIKNGFGDKMHAKGGNKTLTDEDLKMILDYMLATFTKNCIKK